MRNAHTHAFSLIELLVVIAIVALLVSIILPALAQARLAAQLAVSQANMRTQGQMMLLYANDQKDSFVNPFDKPVSGVNTTLGIPWTSVLVQREPGSNEEVRFAHAQRSTEAFAMHWSSRMHGYMGDNDVATAQKSQFSPLDYSCIERRNQWSSDVFSGKAPGTFTSILWDVSYWTTPTLWIKPSRYTSNTTTPVRATAGPGGSDYWRRNRTGDVTFPMAKVMIFERFDFSKKTRAAGPIGNPGAVRQAAYPSFNNPEATARFVTCDGSVSSVRIRDLESLAADSDTHDVYAPSGGWKLDDAHLQDYKMENDGIQNGGANGGPYGAFFWSTRDGIKGRDIPR